MMKQMLSAPWSEGTIIEALQAIYLKTVACVQEPPKSQQCIGFPQ